MEEELTGKGVDLPREVTHEILSRLPAKPLCRFKLVSKSWLSLISNTKFIAMHSKAAQNHHNVLFQRRRVIFADSQSSRHYSLDLDQFLDDVDAPVITRLGFHRAPISRTLSCDGLLLIETSSLNSEIYLVNPLAMKPKQLPKPPVSFKLPRFSIQCNLSSFGLGFDYSSNEHKVVHLGRVSDYELAFNVYALESDSWRQAARRSFFPKKPMVSGRGGVFVNGGIHWLIRGDQKNTGVNILIGDRKIENKKVGDSEIANKRIEDKKTERVFSKDGILIIGFMITKEKITTIRLPRILVRSNNPDVELGVFRDGLCITFISRYGKGESYDEFWVMKEYGVKESWTKMQISIPYHSLSHSGFWRGSYDLMKINTDENKSSLVMYNFEDEEFSTLRIMHKGQDFRYGSVGVYVESLASVGSSVITSSQPSRKRKINIRF